MLNVAQVSLFCAKTPYFYQKYLSISNLFSYFAFDFENETEY